jgi:hypothetical protein
MNVIKTLHQKFSAQEMRANCEPMADRTVDRYSHDLLKNAGKDLEDLVNLNKRLLSLLAPILPANDGSYPFLQHCNAATALQSIGRKDALHLQMRIQAGRAKKELPALFIFSDQDDLIKIGWLNRFEQNFALHRSIVMKSVHHFPQWNDPAGIANVISHCWEGEIEP